jgi:integral membrane protein (TIGR01906 family)
MKEKNSIPEICGWFVAGLIPFILLMVSIRLMITPLYARFEYNLPGFPEDDYGFTLDDRLKWSEPSIVFLVNSADISYLGSLSFENGEPIYNDLELSHMEDVKAVVTGMRIALAVCLVVILVINFIAFRGGWLKQIYQSYSRGGWMTVGLIAAILFFVLLSFDQLFTWFHQIFFESGTWRFYTSDTLIRLFPMRFWRDSFIFVGILCLIMGGSLILIGRRLVKHK